MSNCRLIWVQATWFGEQVAKRNDFLWQMTVRDQPLAPSVSGPDPRTAEAHRLAGVRLYRRRRFSEATAQFSAWAEKAPDHAKAYLCLARAQLMGGDCTAARKSLRRAIGLDVSLIRGHLLLTRLSVANGNLWQAQLHLKHAVDAQPDNPSLRVRLAKVMLDRAQHGPAMAMAQTAMARNPGCSSAALVIARCHIARGETAKARAILARLTGDQPHWAELRAVRADLDAKCNSRNRPARSIDAARGQTLEKGAGAAVEVPEGSRNSPAGEGRARIAFAMPAIGALAPPGIGIVDHLLILRALILRDLALRHRENRIGFITEFVRPTLVIAAHYFWFWVINKRMPGNIPIEAFVIAGFSVWFAFNYSLHGAINGAKWPAGATLVPGVTQMHLRLAKVAWAVSSNLFLCLACAIALSVYGDNVTIPDIPHTALIFLLAGGVGLGLGLVLEATSRWWPALEPMEKILTWGLYVTAGLYFSLSQLIPVLAEVLWYNPILHLIEAQRQAFDGGYPVAMITILYPAGCALGLLFTGLATNRCTRHLAHG
jgi:capsular polysaccharide transport system permease protein